MGIGTLAVKFEKEPFKFKCTEVRDEVKLQLDHAKVDPPTKPLGPSSGAQRGVITKQQVQPPVRMIGITSRRSFLSSLGEP